MSGRARRAVTALLVVAFAVTSCGTATGPSGGSGAVVTDATIKVGAAQGIPQLNPAIRTFAWEESLFPLLWSGLTRWGRDGRVRPDLATKWEHDADATEWTFTLDDKAVFSDGKPITADAVVAVFRYYLKPGTATQEANKIAVIEKVSAAGPRTVKFTLESANALLPEAVTNVKIFDASKLSSINKEPVTSGPYKVASFVPDDTLKLVRNDAYWGGKPTIENIEIVKAADSASAVTSLRSGDLDVLWSLPLSDVGPLKKDPGVSLVTPKTPSQATTWEMDLTSAPFDDVRARQALAYATDRAAILKSAYYGQGAVSTTNTIVADASPWHAGGLTTYPYDLDKAKRLFAEAGVKKGSTITWWGVAGQYPEWQTSAEILQASLAEIGIKLDIRSNELSKWVQKFYPAGKSYPSTIVPNFQSVPPEPAFSMNFLLPGRCECNWDDKRFATGFNGALGDVDVDARKKAWADLQRMENQQVPLITPVQVGLVTAVNAKVSGAWLEGGGQLHLESAKVSR